MLAVSLSWAYLVDDTDTVKCIPRLHTHTHMHTQLLYGRQCVRTHSLCSRSWTELTSPWVIWISWAGSIPFLVFLGRGLRILEVSRYVWFRGMYVIDIAWDRVFYEIYRHKHEGEIPVCCIKHEDSHTIVICVYITATPYRPCNTEGTVWLYYTLATLTTGYKFTLVIDLLNH